MMNSYKLKCYINNMEYINHNLTIMMTSIYVIECIIMLYIYHIAKTNNIIHCTN